MSSKIKDLLVLILLIFLTTLIWYPWIITSFNLNSNIESIDTISPVAPQMCLLEGNSLLPITSTIYIESQTLGMIYGLEPEELLFKIVECESNFNPKVCNLKYGCKAGQGLAMIIPSTEKYCEEKIGRELDMFDPQDNLECARWLLDNEGSGHWGNASASWGTYWCFKDYL